MDSNDLYGIALLLSMIFFIGLCVIRVFVFIPPLNDPRERLVAGLLVMIFTGGSLAVLANVLDKPWLLVIARIWMLVAIWSLNSFIIHYWTLVANGDIAREKKVE